MGYHHCPIEPSDWSDGPDDSGICQTCYGEGEYEGDNGKMVICESCDGKGFVEPEHFDDDAI